ncbi:hypothetical protein GFV14_00261 [Candidatus Hartigia pinicola]|nr:hypothetical protein GFV14_00261 [Candidatus Hartigia pinicola]
MNLYLKVKTGWSSKDSIVFHKLQAMTISLHIYGNWNTLKYQLNIQKIFYNELEIQAQEILRKLLKKKKIIKTYILN